MTSFRIRSHRSEWKVRRRAVEDELARADQEQRQAWINATRSVPEQWTADMLDRLGTDLREPGEWGDTA